MMRYNFQSTVCCFLVLVAILNLNSNGVMAVYGGGTCDIPTDAPGASTKCTAKENGFCAVEAIKYVASPAGITTAGFCVCYPGYKGDKCQDKDPSTAPSGTTTGGTTGGGSKGNALGALALGGLAALALSQLGGGGLGGYGGDGYGPGGISPRERLYLQQATAY